jgi:hypothetical protein
MNDGGASEKPQIDSFEAEGNAADAADPDYAKKA